MDGWHVGGDGDALAFRSHGCPRTPRSPAGPLGGAQCAVGWPQNAKRGRLRVFNGRGGDPFWNFCTDVRGESSAVPSRRKHPSALLCRFGRTKKTQQKKKSHINLQNKNKERWGGILCQLTTCPPSPSLPPRLSRFTSAATSAYSQQPPPAPHRWLQKHLEERAA